GCSTDQRPDRSVDDEVGPDRANRTLSELLEAVVVTRQEQTEVDVSVAVALVHPADYLTLRTTLKAELVQRLVEEDVTSRAETVIKVLLSVVQESAGLPGMDRPVLVVPVEDRKRVG